MPRPTTSAILLAAAAVLASPLAAAAKTRDCSSNDLISMVSFTFNAASRDHQTVSVNLRNNTRSLRLRFSASFSAPEVQSSFVAGRQYEIHPLGNMTLALGNVLNSAANEGFARRVLRLTCG